MRKSHTSAQSRQTIAYSTCYYVGMSGCAIVGAIVGGLLGAIMAAILAVLCFFDYWSPVCAFQRSGDALFYMIGGALIGALCVGGFINWAERRT